MEEDYKQGWRQHFPTYSFEARDIALEEYKVAAKSLESEERVFLNASNIALVNSTALGYLVIGSFEKLNTVFLGVIPSFIILIILLTIVLCFSFISLKYFSDRQRAVVFAGRKVIILRRMLGLSYGQVQLLLPNWRVEGADEPLGLRLFPGWLTYAAYPFWIISIIACSVVFFLSAYLIKLYPEFILTESYVPFILTTTVLWFLFSMLVYRHSLLDLHENIRLILCKHISKMIGLPLAENIEYIIYRAKLATYEMKRLKVSTANLSRFLVFIEDQDFYTHSGISYKALLRSFLGLFKIKPRSGGSTIVQQLSRTLFIRNLEKTKRRKFVEFGLAPWLTTIFPKDMILSLYLSSVRFERKCFGAIRAMEHFFGQVETAPSNAQAFFLIERVSNIRSKLLVNKIIDTARAAKAKELLLAADMKELSAIYDKAVLDQKIDAEQSELTRLTEALNASSLNSSVRQINK